MRSFLVFLFIFLLVVEIFTPFISTLGYYDELIFIFSIIFALTHQTFFNKIPKQEKKILICYFILIIIGIVSTIKYHIQPQFSGIWRDLLAVSKFPVLYYIFYSYTSKKTKDFLQKRNYKIAQIYIVIISICAIANFFIKYEPWTDGIRYGFPLFQFYYRHSTFLICSLFASLSVIISRGFKKNIVIVILASLCVILTFRSKPIFTLLLMGLMYFLKNSKSINLKSWKVILPLIFILIMTKYLVSQRLEEYTYYYDSSARTLLYIRGIDLANMYFPLGSGFCTFASTLSTKYYSPLYSELHLDGIWGLIEGEANYSGDTFWPNIYAQYGYIGFLIYLGIIIYIFKSICCRFNIFSNKWIAATTIFIYSISASLAESFYTNSSVIIFLYCLCISIGSDEKNRVSIIDNKSTRRTCN